VILRLHHPNGAVERHEIDKPEVILGRGAVADLRLRSSHIARHHCRITQHQRLTFVEDLGSTNGTHLGEQWLRGPHLLQPGERLRLVEFHLEVEDCRAVGEEECEALARDPALPLPLLCLLGYRAPRAFLENPLLPLLALEDPGFFLKLRLWLVRRLLELERLPEGLFQAALDGAGAHDVEIRARLAERRDTPPGILLRLAGDPARLVQERLLANPAPPREALLRLAAEGSTAELREAAEERLAGG
jgi:hypothetical protein